MGVGAGVLSPASTGGCASSVEISAGHIHALALLGVDSPNKHLCGWVGGRVIIYEQATGSRSVEYIQAQDI